MRLLPDIDHERGEVRFSPGNLVTAALGALLALALGPLLAVLS